MATPLREKIVVALDVGAEMSSPWDVKRPDGPSRFEVVVKSLKNWVIQKELMSPGRQEYALVSLGLEAELGLSWTTERDMVWATLDSLSPCTESPDVPLDLGTLVQVCERDLGGFKPTCDRTTTRLLIIFGRSDTVPTVSQSFRSLDCFLDALYVHRKQSEGDNRCQEIYTFLTSLEAKSQHKAPSYFFETSTSLPRLQQSCGLLLAHPLIRDAEDAMLRKLDWKPLAQQASSTSHAPTRSPLPTQHAVLQPNLLPDPANLLPRSSAGPDV